MLKDLFLVQKIQCSSNKKARKKYKSNYYIRKKKIIQSEVQKGIDKVKEKPTSAKTKKEGKKIMKLKVINIEGKKTEDIEISDKIFSLKPNHEMIKSFIDWQLNHFKPRTAKTKQRGEVKGSTSKIYAQKGTGGARHSSRKAPIFVGGGIAHGP